MVYEIVGAGVIS